MKSGVEQGAAAVFYPKGSSWGAAPAVMYISKFAKNPPKMSTLREVMNSDVADFKKDGNVRVVDASPFQLPKVGSVPVRHFLRSGAYEAIAYLDRPGVVFVLALSSKTESDFKKSLGAFRKFVLSYREK